MKLNYDLQSSCYYSHAVALLGCLTNLYFSSNDFRTLGEGHIFKFNSSACPKDSIDYSATSAMFTDGKAKYLPGLRKCLMCDANLITDSP